jgi:hypothetical protein
LAKSAGIGWPRAQLLFVFFLRPLVIKRKISRDGGAPVGPAINNGLAGNAGDDDTACSHLDYRRKRNRNFISSSQLRRGMEDVALPGPALARTLLGKYQKHFSGQNDK